MLRAKYGSPKSVKNMLRNLDGLMHLARKGDTVAHSIFIDLNNAFYFEGVLTFRQRKFLQLWLEGYRQIDIAANHRISQQAVEKTINRGVRNITIYLKQGVV